jgi:hypothetical protein
MDGNNGNGNNENNGNDHFRLPTEDGLTEMDHHNGYHWYGSYKVLHVCVLCNGKRDPLHYGGFLHTDLCNNCYHINRYTKNEINS